MEEDQFRGYGGEGEHVYKDGIAKLRNILGGGRVAMLTTADETGALRSRPMVVQKIDDEGDAWLVTDEGSAKVHEVRHENHVNLAWLRPVLGRWLSVTGRASVVRDRQKLKEVWDPMLQAWFPGGVEDPSICLLRVRLDEAVSWDAPLGNMLQISKLAGTLLGRGGRGGEQARDTIVIRSRQAGIGDTAGIFGTAGGSMGTARKARGERMEAGGATGRGGRGAVAETSTRGRGVQAERRGGAEGRGGMQGRGGAEARGVEGRGGTEARGGTTGRGGAETRGATGRGGAETRAEARGGTTEGRGGARGAKAEPTGRGGAKGGAETTGRGRATVTPAAGRGSSGGRTGQPDVPSGRTETAGTGRGATARGTATKGETGARKATGGGQKVRGPKMAADELSEDMGSEMPPVLPGGAVAAALEADVQKGPKPPPRAGKRGGKK